MITAILSPLIGGLALFLFGMGQMSDGLRRAAGKKLRRVIELLTKTVPMSVGVGALVTCIIQSSSATTVMVVGFVNAGLLRLREAIGTIMGANIGTTITAWLIALVACARYDVKDLALPMVGVGLLAHATGRERGMRSWGQALFGLGFILLGLGFMEEAFKPLHSHEGVKAAFAYFGQNVFLGFCTGAAVTAIVQSSSVTIGMIQLLAAGAVIDLHAAIPLMLGTHVGTCVTANLAAIGTSTNAKRAARAHLLFNLFGIVYLPFLVPFERLVAAIVPGGLIPPTIGPEGGVTSPGNVAVLVAVAHTLSAGLCALALMPFVRGIERAVVRLVPGDDDEMMGTPEFLEKHLLNTPLLALDSAKQEILRMMRIAAKATAAATAGFFDGKRKVMKRVAQREDAIDQLQGEITDYLVEIARRDLEHVEASEFPTLIHVVNDVERIGDHAMNIAELADTYRKGKLVFSKAAFRDLRKMNDEVSAMMDESIKAVEENDMKVAKNALKREERINTYEVDCRKSHAARLARKRCEVAPGIIFLDVVTNLEKIGDHLTNINQAVLGAFQWGEKFRLTDEE